MLYFLSICLEQWKLLQELLILDLSKAIDLVSYDLFWAKMRQVSIPCELIGILVLSNWYESQTNVVNWANECSDPHILDCSLREEGLTSSILLIYM